MRQRRIIFAGGGTGGHLFPAFALAKEIERRLKSNCEIRFFVSGRELEDRLVREHNYRSHRLHLRGIRRGTIVGNLIFPLLLAYSLLEAIVHIIRYNPDFVVGTGGYLSFPAVLAAKMTQRPAFIQEQNSFAGVATRKAARFADLIFIAYEDTARQLQWLEKCILSGNPVRPGLAELEPQAAREQLGLDPDKQTILIVGGSQGAASINEKIRSQLEIYGQWEGRQLLWQVGADEERSREFATSQTNGKATSFIDDMAAAYAAADLVVCRAGALTLAELTAAGKPALLIPYPHATDDHQTRNAQALVEAGAAELIADDQLSEFDLAARLDALLSEPTQLLQMSMAASGLGRQDAAKVIVQRMFEFMGWR
jgi:UDP-N-acetylglucosamine--N-acetylmuramyl-(pentapeptide) pyrophosphoryl-undecaprenol N-acetylglucosamine transferase